MQGRGARPCGDTAPLAFGVPVTLPYLRGFADPLPIFPRLPIRSADPLARARRKDIMLPPEPPKLPIPKPEPAPKPEKKSIFDLDFQLNAEPKPVSWPRAGAKKP